MLTLHEKQEIQTLNYCNSESKGHFTIRSFFVSIPHECLPLLQPKTVTPADFNFPRLAQALSQFPGPLPRLSQ